MKPENSNFGRSKLGAQITGARLAATQLFLGSRA